MSEMVIIYDGPNACQRCHGWKRVDNGELQSWKYWAELPEQSKIAVRLGLVKPITCPDCNGTGINPEAEPVTLIEGQPSKRIVASGPPGDLKTEMID
jgi:hypothetical protein